MAIARGGEATATRVPVIENSPAARPVRSFTGPTVITAWTTSVPVSGGPAEPACLEQAVAARTRTAAPSAEVSVRAMITKSPPLC
jgi:hypothetical protein